MSQYAYAPNQASYAGRAGAPARQQPQEGQQAPRLSAKEVLAAVLLALVPAVVLCLVHAPVYATSPDDFVQELFVRGQFQAGSSTLMPYTLVLVSAPLAALYKLAAHVPWYALNLLALTVISFAILWGSTLRLRLSRAWLVIVGAVALSCEVLCVWYFTYTIVAFLALAAGLMLIMPRAVFGDAGRPGLSDVAGLLLVAVGFSLRPESGLAALVLFVPFLVYALVRSRRAGTLLRALAVVLVIGACYGAGQLAYRTTAGWEDFPSYLDAGRKVLDTQQMSTEQVQAAAPELSDNDVAFMYSWDFVDHSVYSIDVFKRIGAADSTYSPSHFLASFKAKITYLLMALTVLLAAAAWVLARLRRLERPVRALSFGVVAMAFVSYLLIVMRGRPRLHIVIPVAIVTFMALIVCCQGPNKRRTSRGKHAAHAAVEEREGSSLRLRVAAGAVCVVCALGLGGFWYTSVRPLQNRLSLPFATNVGQYVEENPSELVVFAHTQSAWFSGTDAFASASWQCPDNVLFVGGWESETASWDETLQRWDLTDDAPLQSLATRKDMVLVATESTAELYQTYLQEHVSSGVLKEKVCDLGSGAVSTSVISVWRFSA